VIQTPSLGRQVLVVDDDEALCSTTTEILHCAGCDAVGASDIAEARRILAQGDVALVLLDVGLDFSGLRLLDDIADPPRVILISGYRDRRLPEGLTLLAKPISPDRLVDEVRHQLASVYRLSGRTLHHGSTTTCEAS